jgi:hypothetical protein
MYPPFSNHRLSETLGGHPGYGTFTANDQRNDDIRAKDRPYHVLFHDFDLFHHKIGIFHISVQTEQAGHVFSAFA